MLARLAVALIRLYQLTLSRLVGRVCRFEPSCSRYAIACLEEHGLARGGLLSLRRLCKCHPFHPGGYDPPPRLARDAQPAWKREGRARAVAAQPRAAD
jgi:putative membrane protein insertion efficiency factor